MTRQEIIVALENRLKTLKFLDNYAYTVGVKRGIVDYQNIIEVLKQGGGLLDIAKIGRCGLPSYFVMDIPDYSNILEFIKLHNDDFTIILRLRKAVFYAGSSSLEVKRYWL